MFANENQTVDLFPMPNQTPLTVKVKHFKRLMLLNECSSNKYACAFAFQNNKYRSPFEIRTFFFF